MKSFHELDLSRSELPVDEQPGETGASLPADRPERPAPAPSQAELALQEQFALLERERAKLARETHEAKEDLAAREEALARRAQLLVARLPAVYERERRVAAEEERLRAAQQELASPVATPDQAPPDWAQRERGLQDEVRRLRQEAEAHVGKLKEMEAERDRIRSELVQLQEQVELAEKGRGLLSAHSEPWFVGLSGQESDQPEGPEEVGPQVLSPVADLAPLAHITPEELQRLREQAGQLEQVTAERDDALEQLRRKTARSETAAAHEAEFARLHAELKQARQRLEDQIKGLQKREASSRPMEGPSREQIERESANKRAQQEAEFARLHAELKQERQRLEARIKELQKREMDSRATEAFLREQIERAEQESSGERAQLAEEKLGLTRAWEALRKEQKEYQARLEAEFRTQIAAGMEAARARRSGVARAVQGSAQTGEGPSGPGRPPRHDCANHGETT
jgi:chromosome segregation ATPase